VQELSRRRSDSAVRPRSDSGSDRGLTVVWPGSDRGL